MFVSCNAEMICMMMNETETIIQISFTGFFNFRAPIFLLLILAVEGGANFSVAGKMPNSGEFTFT